MKAFWCLGCISWLGLIMSCSSDTNVHYSNIEYMNGIKIGMTKKGKKIGLWVSFYDNGRVRGTSFYDDDIETGPYKYYDIDGSLLIDTNLLNGDYDGSFTSYYSSGEIQQKGYFINAKEDGKWYFYSEKGEIDRVELYKNGIKEKIILDNKRSMPIIEN
jgi:antitoxin component YwqK of YwqJK toxin-antitoxin module